MFKFDPTSWPLHRKECRHGSFTYYAADNPIGQSLAEYGEWAEAEVTLFARLIRPGDTIVEAGSNIGIHTLALARMVGATGVVYAFEPMACNNQLLNANIIANDIINVRSYQMALGESNAIISFPAAWADHQNNFGSFGLQTIQISPTTPTIPCAMISIDCLALPRVDVIKIDVEGGERAVLIGAMTSIVKNRPALLVETLNQFSMLGGPDGNLPWIIDQLKPLGYSFWHYVTPLYNRKNWLSNPNNVFLDQWSFDVLCLPKERFSVTGLESAESGPPSLINSETWRSISIIRFG